jgi:DNA repair photolyase
MEVLELGHAVLQFLFSQGIGVAFLTKGHIPDRTLRLLIDHAPLVRVQIGLLTLNERISRIFEPHAASPLSRLAQLGELIGGGVLAEARIDPVLPGLTDSPDLLDVHFAALRQAGVKRAAAGVLFLRPTILTSLKRNLSGKETLVPLLSAYRSGQEAVMRGAQFPIQNPPSQLRREIFARMGAVSQAHGIDLNVCACKNPDLVRGSCNIAGTWPRSSPRPIQPLLLK